MDVLHAFLLPVLDAEGAFGPGFFQGCFIAAEMDEAKRKDLVKEYQELLWDQMPLVPVYHGYSFSVKASRLQGYNGFESAQNNQRVWEWSVTQ